MKILLNIKKQIPLPLRSVLDAPHRGAGPEPAGETGVGLYKADSPTGETRGWAAPDSLFQKRKKPGKNA